MSHSAWLEQAESDLDAAKVLSASDFHSQAVWLASQSVEKAHKAILAALGLRYQERHYKQLGHRTAEISELLPAALHEPVDPRIADMLVSLDARAISARYPASMKAAGARSHAGSTCPVHLLVCSGHRRRGSPPGLVSRTGGARAPCGAVTEPAAGPVVRPGQPGPIPPR